MKRRDVLKSGLVLAGTTAVAAPAIAQSAPTIRWRLTSSFPKSLDTIYGGGEFFADRVNKLTDGKFNIRQQNAWMYHGGGIDTLNAFFKDYGVIAFSAGNTGAQMGGWFKNPVNTL